MATVLGLYNAALMEIGEGTLASVSEARKPRYVLDTVYSNVLATCLEAGEWNFAIREVTLAYDSTITPEFGFPYVFAKPSDWVRTSALAANDTYTPPLADHEYKDDVNYWSAGVTPLYVRYVSNSTDWGLNLSNWPMAFQRFVEVALADRIVMAITQNSTDKDRLERLTLPKAKRQALNKDAMNEGAKFRRVSTWNASRGGGGSRERGNRSRLIG